MYEIDYIDLIEQNIADAETARPRCFGHSHGTCVTVNFLAPFAALH